MVLPVVIVSATVDPCLVTDRTNDGDGGRFLSRRPRLSVCLLGSSHSVSSTSLLRIDALLLSRDDDSDLLSDEV